MSPEREIVEKFKEAMETKNLGILTQCMAEDATCDVLPSTFVIVPEVYFPSTDCYETESGGSLPGLSGSA